MPDDRPWWEAWRDRMPVVEKWAYFDHAAVAPISADTRAAMDAWTRDAAEEGDAAWPKWRKSVENTRRLAAELLGASTREIALVRNTTEGIGLVAEGFPWEPGDNVVTFASEFPSNRFPWMNLAARDVECRLVAAEEDRIDLNRLDDACDGRTRIVSLSWVGYATGFRTDLDAAAEIAHRHGALLFVDAIQGLGVFPLDVSQTSVDFLAADGHKWLLGPEGAGLLFVREEHLRTLRPLMVGWNSAGTADFTAQEMQLKTSAARYEGGTFAMPGLVGFESALEAVVEAGVEAVSRRLLDVTDELSTRVESAGAAVVSDRQAERRSGILAVDVPGREPLEFKQACLDRGVLVNTRAGHVRLSPHVYTDERDLGRLLDVMGQV